MKKTNKNACPSCGKFKGHELRCEAFRATRAPKLTDGDPSERELVMVQEIAGMTPEELNECSQEMVQFAVNRLVRQSYPS